MRVERLGGIFDLSQSLGFHTLIHLEFKHGFPRFGTELGRRRQTYNRWRYPAKRLRMAKHLRNRLIDIQGNFRSHEKLGHWDREFKTTSRVESGCHRSLGHDIATTTRHGRWVTRVALITWGTDFVSSRAYNDSWKSDWIKSREDGCGEDLKPTLGWGLE
jgi:hypothetical protein